MPEQLIFFSVYLWKSILMSSLAANLIKVTFSKLKWTNMPISSLVYYNRMVHSWKITRVTTSVQENFFVYSKKSIKWYQYWYNYSTCSHQKMSPLPFPNCIGPLKSEKSFWGFSTPFGPLGRTSPDHYFWLWTIVSISESFDRFFE